MQKYSFYNDYSEGAHPAVLKSLMDLNEGQETGYGLDSISAKAADLIRGAIGDSKADVHFVSAGTQANIIVLAAMMKPYESVISAGLGHINFHEAGAVEATGHKINGVDCPDGKLNVDLIEKMVKMNTDEHMVKPRVVYISNASELGTVYSKAELEAISAYCRANGLYFYMDGARLAMALCAEGNDVTLKDIAKLVDAFYIGGTKNGALCGEAIVIINEELKKNFRYYLKQRGALLAKGRLVGAQFVALFTEDLYFELARHANSMAGKLREGMKKKGFKFLTESTNNQLFPILSHEQIEKMKELYGFYVWENVDSESSAIRLVTSWATKEEMVEEFLRDLG